eukprot:8904480-Alexandrium_andersonii.AAC.1
MPGRGGGQEPPRLPLASIPARFLADPSGAEVGARLQGTRGGGSCARASLKEGLQDFARCRGATSRPKRCARELGCSAVDTGAACDHRPATSTPAYR